MPTVIDLRGNAERITNLLTNLGGGVRDIINPNFEFQKQMQASIAQNPGSLEALKALPPEVLSGMGFSDDQLAAISAAPRSAEGLIGELSTGLLQNEEFLSKFMPFLEANIAGASSPTAFAVEPTRAKVAADLAATDEEAIRRGVRTELTGEDRLTEATTNIRIGALDRAMEAFNQLPAEAQRDIDLRETFATIEGDVRFQREAELAILLQQMKFRQSLELEMSKGNNRIRDLFEELELRSANEYRDKTNVGTTMQWRAYLENPALGETAAFAHIRRAVGEMEDTELTIQRSRLSGRLQEIMNNIQRGVTEAPDDRGSLGLLAAEANRALQEIHALGGPDIRMNLNLEGGLEKGLFGTASDPGFIRIIDNATGQVLGPDEIAELPTRLTIGSRPDPAEGTRVRISISGSPVVIDPTGLSPAAKRALEIIGSGQATFEELVSNPNRRGVAAEILQSQVIR